MGCIHGAVYQSMGIKYKCYDPVVETGFTEDCVIEQADIVSICSPDNFHTDQICKALAAGKDVFCEKPLCHTPDELDRIKAAYEESPGRLGCNFPLRYQPCFVEAKRKINDLGEIYLVEADYEWGRRDKMQGWRGDMEYNIVMGGGLHMIDLVMWITEAGIKSWDMDEQHYHALVAVCTFRLKNDIGAVFKLTCDFGGNKQHMHRLRICGTRDSLYIENTDPTDKQQGLRDFIDGKGPTAEEIFRVHEIGLGL